MGYNVYCTSASGERAKNTHGRCAERSLALKGWAAAVRHGARGLPRVADWIRRHYGAWTVERVLSDGSCGVSVPCLLCRRAMDRLGVRWVATSREGCRVGSTDPEPPKSSLTRRQKQQFIATQPI